jgi:Calx-beta domain/Matrixin
MKRVHFFALSVLLSALTVASSTDPTAAAKRPGPQTASSFIPTSSLDVPEVCFAPGTSPQVLRQNALRRRAQLSSLQPFQFNDGDRWASTATNGGGLSLGQVTTLTWNIVPDGTPIAGFNGEPAAPSNLKAFLQGIYGSEAAWLAQFQTVFNQWGALTGVSYVKETADDGAALSFVNNGVLGVRADIRIGGHFIDGDFNVLAYNFFPDSGDMVIDTADSYYSDPGGGLANGSRGFRNMLAHEHGHGLGFEHSCPIANSKLMEPFLSTAFDHAQLDDKLAGWRGYGDDKEDNETSGTAANLGSLSNGTTTVNELSLDGSNDIDFYKFTVPAGKKAAVTLTPIGSTYLAGPQNPNGSCSAGTSFNALTRNDVGVELRGTDGNAILASANAGGAGATETIAATVLPGAGTFFIRAFPGGNDAPQGYRLDVTISDAVTTISINDLVITEGNAGTTNAVFTLSLNAASGVAVSVSAITAGDTATSGVDFSATGPTTITFNPGITTRTFSVPVIGDLALEANEKFFVNLSAPTNAILGDSQGQAIINNDDSTISVTNNAVAEGTTGAPSKLLFNVVLSATSIYTITVDYATANGTATAGSDYTAKNGTLTFVPGAASQTIEVAVTQDATVEPDETVLLNLSNATQATIADNQGVGTIQADDGLLVSIADKTSGEGNAGFTPVDFKVTLSAPAPGPGNVTVNWATANGTAVQPGDYTAANGAVTFAAGEQTKTVTVQVVGDVVQEPYETFFVNLSSPTGGAAIGDGQGQGTITNTDGTTGRSRLMFHNFVSNRLYRWHMTGGNALDTFNWVTPWATDPGWTVGAVADFDQDGQLDYLWHNVNDGRMLFWYIDGDNLKGFQFLPYTMGPPWRVATAFDADGNLTQDIAFYNSTSGVVRVMQHDNATLTGQYDITTNLPGAGTVRVVSASDANNDGDDELVLYNSATGQIQAWNVAGATVAGTINYPNTQVTVPAYTLVSTKTDFNNDGRPDLLWHNPTPTGIFSVWFMNGTARLGTGSFTPFSATDPVWKVVGSANLW